MALQNLVSRHEGSTGLGFQSQLGSLYETIELHLLRCAVYVYIAFGICISVHRRSLRVCTSNRYAGRIDTRAAMAYPFEEA